LLGAFLDFRHQQSKEIPNRSGSSLLVGHDALPGLAAFGILPFGNRPNRS
jgi:hypothetical protein